MFNRRQKTDSRSGGLECVEYYDNPGVTESTKMQVQAQGGGMGVNSDSNSGEKHGHRPVSQVRDVSTPYE